MSNNVKTPSSRHARKACAEYLSHGYRKPFFCHRAYRVSSVDGASLQTVTSYIQNPGQWPA